MLAHLSSSGAGSTFKSRSSFSFTFCLLPGRARLTWGREPPPIGGAKRGGDETGLRPLPPGLAASGLQEPRAELAGRRTGACARDPRRANLKGSVGTVKAPGTRPGSPKAASKGNFRG